MAENDLNLEPCPICDEVPHIGYCCGEYMIFGDDSRCPCCGHAFTEMHSNKQEEIKAWNRRVADVIKQSK